MPKIFIDKKYFTDRKAKWVSFEDSPRLKETKGDIYSRCVPCITNLYEQLKQGKKEVRLGPAFSCWKVVVVLESMDECVELLTELEKRLVDPIKVKGRFGSVDENKQTKVVVFNAAGESQRERLYEILAACAECVNPFAEVSFHRGCAELYHELFGDWKAWREEETIRKPEAVPVILDRIRKVLFWEKDRSEQGNL
ncbi:MAG: hypothetical protein A4E63_00139 [Syntrophorhabdus sp. PtaU1.Bin050]|nr:MAG: hypothetical protein A4E63_00139 [Syntrophorhabdus sp. PtaU1.Bin050]